ncbi:MAG: hypothetical protein KVP17_002133 [Porospora cf. gigantea B]|uniref:uncharacterized protein n=1 Tax=Porospora cf. gigantea B TaxID=2853592 RepID=UPI003571DD94|nr:MAG: hypothetical protein KVP17_002133 [Porospora cf. gigantea B]
MSIARTYQQERLYIENINDHSLRIKRGFVPNMNVEGIVYVNPPLELLLRDELASYCKRQAGNNKALAGFLPAVKQIANVAALPGIVRRAIGLPDVHSGYGFAIGNVAAFDTLNEKAVVSPGGIGFDINCGVRVLRTNLMEADVEEYKEEIAQQLFNHVPVGVGSRGIIPCNRANLEESLYLGLDWSVREGYAWVEDKEKCEEYGRMLMADPSTVSQRAKKRGLPQMGTLGAGNHYVEMQVVDEIYDSDAAKQMGIERVGQVCVMVHSGSRGLGHQVATDALQIMEKSDIKINDPQLACARIHSKAGQE